MNAQIENVISSATAYARDVSGKTTGDDFKRVAAAYLSGVLSAAGGLAAADGVHPSKLVEAAREAGRIMLGVKSTPFFPGPPRRSEDESGAEVVAHGRVIRDTGDQLIGVNTEVSTSPVAGPVPSGKIHVTFARYRTVEWDKEGDLRFDDASFKVHDAACPEAKLIAALVKP